MTLIRPTLRPRLRLPSVVSADGEEDACRSGCGTSRRWLTTATASREQRDVPGRADAAAGSDVGAARSALTGRPLDEHEGGARSATLSSAERGDEVADLAIRS